jgi:hypothetical protein
MLCTVEAFVVIFMPNVVYFQPKVV